MQLYKLPEVQAAPGDTEDLLRKGNGIRINKIIELIKICLRWLRSKLRRKQVSAKEEKRTEEGFPKYRFRFPERPFWGLLNRPKRQRCPVCGKWSKREEKTMGGANYRCPKHGLFFVRV